MADITLSKAVRSNLLNLQATAVQLGKTQERLATGLKVNSALDNPTNFFTASSLNSRASDMGRLLDSVSNAVQTIAAADKGLTALTKLVESAQATARQALQTAATVDTVGAATAGAVTGGAFTALNFTVASATPAILTGGTFTDIDLSNNADNEFAFDINGDTITLTDADGTAGVISIGEAITAIQTQMDALNAGAGNGITVSEGTGADAGKLVFTTTATGTSATIEIDNIAATGTGVVATAPDLGFTNGDDAAGANAGAAKTLSFQVAADGGSAATVTINLAAVQAVGNSDGTIDSVAELAAIVDAQLGSGVVVDGTGATLVLRSATTGATSSVAITSTTATNITNTSGVANASNTGSASSTTSGPNPKRDELRVQYNDLLDQINQLAKDTGFNGVNLLNGDSLSVLFNEDGTSKLDVTGVTYNALGLGLTALTSGDFDTNADINATLDTLKSAVDTLRTQASKFGSNLSVVETRQDFTKNMINVLQTGAANLTLADTNEEAANLLALQTRQQLSSTALSLASQADQNVLRLF